MMVLTVQLLFDPMTSAVGWIAFHSLGLSDVVNAFEYLNNRDTFAVPIVWCVYLSGIIRHIS